MPKVLRIINRFNLGGPTYNATYLTKYMAPEFETLLVGGYKDPSEENSDFIVKNLGIEPVIIPEMRRQINPHKDFLAYMKLKKIIHEFKPDIVHTHASKAGSLGRTAAYHCNVPIILHTFHGHVFHSYFNSLMANTFITIERRLAKLSTKIIAVSEKQKEELAGKYKIAEPEKIIIIPLGFDFTRFRENMAEKRIKFRKEFSVNDDETAIAIIGRLVPVKNHAAFLESIKYVKEKSSKKIRAFIVGDGESRADIQALCRQLKLDYTDSITENKPATITFTSWIKDIDYVYAGIDIVSLTSLNEGTPVSIIEAQAAGKPIVSTIAGGIENIVIPGETAILVKNRNINEYSRKLLSVVEDENLGKKLASKGWDFVKNKFHYTRLVEDMKKLYNNLLN